MTAAGILSLFSAAAAVGWTTAFNSIIEEMVGIPSEYTYFRGQYIYSWACTMPAADLKWGGREVAND